MAVRSDGRPSLTKLKVLEHFGSEATYVELELVTGRTHQIRVHMSHHGHPVVGDKTYGVRKEEFKLDGQLLHAYKIGFVHPVSGEYMEFEAEIPDYYKNVLYILRNK